MKIIELLSSQLEREALPHEINAAQHIFTEGLDFWSLCLEARKLLLDEKSAKDEKCLPSQTMRSAVGVSK